MFRLLFKAIFRLQLQLLFYIQLAVTLKKHLELQPEDGFKKKPKHVANMIF
jgi:hypothetical protein